MMDINPDHASSISVYMHRLLKEYDRLRGVAVNKSSFWDAVVISCADAEQQKAFQYQVDKKLSNDELPLGIPYLVVNDPPGPAIGNGGSTLHVLNELSIQFEDKWATMRLLIIHAGGSSKRLPSASILGKLFTPLPLGPKLYQMLDLKLALYLPFLQKMVPGVFITCSDDIETYVLAECTGEGDTSQWTFDHLGFTALAHRSDIDIGKHHGVYVLPKIDSLQNGFTFGPCLEVLQKPSEHLMRKKCAIIEGDKVCTDSVFFFTHDVSAKLIDFYVGNRPLNCEVDAYHDFLQALGSHADGSYIHQGKSTSDRLITLRKKLFELLTGTALNVLFLSNSNFYHLGTCSEYVSNLESNSNLFHDLGMAPVVQCHILNQEKSKINENRMSEFNCNATITCSVVASSLSCRRPVVVEYCYLNADMLIGEGCLLSNCYVESDSILHIPPHCVMHTAAVTVNNIPGFVTVAFGTDDDLKTSVSYSDCGELQLFGQKLKDLAAIFNIQEVFPFVKECSLWNGRFFSLCSTMNDSFQATLRDIQSIHSLQNGPKQFTTRFWLSMAEILEHKDVKRTLAFRDQSLNSFFR